MTFLFLFFLLGVFGGFLSGVLGIGGAILMIPLMLYAPPLFGFTPLSMNAVTGLSMIQVFFASLSGSARHWKNRTISPRLLMSLGVAFSLFALAGALFSHALNGQLLTMIFGCLTVLAAVLMLLPRDRTPLAVPTDGASLHVNTSAALLIGAPVGLLSGLVGVGGGFILIPLMLRFLKTPVRQTVGTSLAVVLFGAVFGAAGKIATGQVVWLPALALTLGAIPAAQAGARVSALMPEKALRRALLAMVLITSLQVWYKILTRP